MTSNLIWSIRSLSLNYTTILYRTFTIPHNWKNIVWTRQLHIYEKLSFSVFMLFFTFSSSFILFSLTSHTSFLPLCFQRFCHFLANYSYPSFFSYSYITPLGRPRRRWVDNIRMDLHEVGCGHVDWIRLAQDRDRWRTLVSAVMNLRVPWNAGNFLTSCKPVSCSGRTLHHGVSK